MAKKPLENERLLSNAFREVTGLVERGLNKEGLRTIQVPIFDKSLEHFVTEDLRDNLIQLFYSIKKLRPGVLRSMLKVIWII